MAFNIRVYGILINDRNEVLLSDEERFDRFFTKFPGGGLEHGEGITDCVKREFREELEIEIQIEELFYLTDYYQPSAFDAKDQLISIYYRVKTDELHKIKTVQAPFETTPRNQEVYRWKPISELDSEDLTFPVDKKVAQMLKAQYE